MAKTPYEVFETMFDNALFSNLKQQFELYAPRDKNSPTFNTTEAEIQLIHWYTAVVGISLSAPREGLLEFC